MTTDPSTEREEAAEDAADLWTRQQGYAMTGTEWGAFAQGHLAGSAWARTHFAAQEPTDAEVEAAAIECVKFLFLTAPERPWEDPEVVEQWEPMARTALRSARAIRRVDAWLARVRQDAAREALDGLMHRFELEQGRAASLSRGLDAQRAKLSRLTTKTYRDTHYPEETP